MLNTEKCRQQCPAIYIGIVLIVILTCLSARASAQTGFRPATEWGELRFSIEAADFRADIEGKHLLEVYYKLFYDVLSYEKQSEGYTGRYRISVIIEDDDGDQIATDTRESKVTLDSFSDTRRTTDFVINMFTFQITPQKVRVRVILEDIFAETSVELDKRLDDRDYWSKYPSVSRVQFVLEHGAASGNSRFNKDTLRIIPNVSRIYGGRYDTLLSYYAEAYPGRVSSKYTKLITQVYHRSEGFVYSDTVRLGKYGGPVRLLQTINVVDFIPGEYELELTLEGRRGQTFDKLTEPFELELTAETIFRTDYNLAVDMLKYIATSKERKMLKNAETPEEQREAWETFWQERARETYDAMNPPQREYFRRIRHANRNFSYMNRPGWKTGRGMVYITYGEPDEVEDFPFELGSKPYQVWTYLRLSPQRQFLFVDEWGDGNYELQPPYNGIRF